MFSAATLESPISLSPRPGWLDAQQQRFKLPFAFLLGAFLALATPGIDLSIVAWFGLCPLIILNRASGGKWRAFFTGLVFGAGYYAIALSFFSGLFPLAWLGIHDLLSVQLVALAWLAEVFHYSLLFGLFSLFQYCLPLRPGFLPSPIRPFYPMCLALPAIYIFLAWVIAPSPFFLGTPVSQLAYTQANNLPLIQLASLGGSALIDFLLVVSNCLIAQAILEFFPLTRKLGQRTDQLNTKVGVLADIALFAFIMSLSLAFGQYRLAKIEEEVRPERATRQNPQTPPIPVAIIQGNVSVEEEKFGTIPLEELTKRYSDLASGTGATLLVLPEGTINSDQKNPKVLKALFKNITEQEKKEVVVGLIEPMKDLDKKEGYINAVSLVSPLNPKQNTYVKERLTPVGETLPVILSEIKKNVPQVHNKNFLAAAKPQLLTSCFGNIGVAIANEVLYPNLIAQRVEKGASLLVVVANLGWFHNSSLNKQILACATLRAVENKRFLILATNTGISSVIDPAGVVASRSFPLKRGILLDTVQSIYSRTPFSKFRWL
jgi:apolipoprotein N-acyltransferase